MEVKAGYKQTEFGVLPKDWEIVSVQELMDRNVIVGHLDGNHGALYPRSHEFVEYGVPYITANELTGYKVEFSTCKYLTEERARRFRKGVAKDGDVLFAHNATVGPTALLSTELEYVILSTTATYYRCNPNQLKNTFLLYALQSEHFARQYRAIMAQSTRNQVPITAQRKLFLVLPPTFAEQEAIAKALSDTDALIGALEQLLAKKRQVKQGAMQELLTGKRRLTGFSGKWEVQKIGEIAHTTAGGTPSTLVASYWGGNIRWMNSGELHLKRVFEVEGRITEEGLRNSSTKIVPPKCVLIGLAGQGRTRGTVAINMIKLCTNQSIAAIFPSSSFVSEYLYFNLDNRYEELREVSSGDGGRGGLNLTLINKLEIPLPSLPEQTAIAEILSDMDAEIAALEGKLAKARQVKQGMMQELLTGRIRLV